ncbi:hypothetical protein EHV15_35695 [Paenibacillus oralis]|uniref:Uncharacterized protein n=1 Tax=Paenibacillus oralis TaxID=2490856 RepID=A0A3P3TA84_9BACL|nr:hypothetical protein [Paenibacillus oralis]RRJ54917.1 hypothetical protein EHV15_35695 [Paenibacillus oralis]
MKNLLAWEQVGDYEYRLLTVNGEYLNKQQGGYTSIDLIGRTIKLFDGENEPEIFEAHEFDGQLDLLNIVTEKLNLSEDDTFHVFRKLIGFKRLYLLYEITNPYNYHTDLFLFDVRDHTIDAFVSEKGFEIQFIHVENAAERLNLFGREYIYRCEEQGWGRVRMWNSKTFAEALGISKHAFHDRYKRSQNPNARNPLPKPDQLLTGDRTPVWDPKRADVMKYIEDSLKKNITPGHGD